MPVVQSCREVLSETYSIVVVMIVTWIVMATYPVTYCHQHEWQRMRDATSGSVFAHLNIRSTLSVYFAFSNFFKFAQYLDPSGH